MPDAAPHCALPPLLLLLPLPAGDEHYAVARGVQKVLQDYKNLQVSCCMGTAGTHSTAQHTRHTKIGMFMVVVVTCIGLWPPANTHTPPPFSHITNVFAHTNPFPP